MNQDTCNDVFEHDSGFRWVCGLLKGHTGPHIKYSLTQRFNKNGGIYVVWGDDKDIQQRLGMELRGPTLDENK